MSDAIPTSWPPPPSPAADSPGASTGGEIALGPNRVVLGRTLLMVGGTLCVMYALLVVGFLRAWFALRPVQRAYLLAHPPVSGSVALSAAALVGILLLIVGLTVAYLTSLWRFRSAPVAFRLDADRLEWLELAHGCRLTRRAVERARVRRVTRAEALGNIGYRFDTPETPAAGRRTDRGPMLHSAYLGIERDRWLAEIEPLFLHWPAAPPLP